MKISTLGEARFDSPLSRAVSDQARVPWHIVQDPTAPPKEQMLFEPAGIAADGPGGAWITNSAGLWRVAFGRPWQ